MVLRPLRSGVVLAEEQDGALMAAARATLTDVRKMCAVALRKYGEHPSLRAPSATALVINAARIGRVLLGERKVRALVEQALTESAISPVEGVD